MEKDYKICASCLQDGDTASSSEWCWDCMEGLCDDCSKYHRKQKPSRHHKLSALSKISKFELFMNYYKTNCLTHPDHEVMSYCQAHQCLCCQMCEESVHKECKDVIPLCEAANKDTLTENVTKKIEEIEGTLELMTENIRKSLVSQGEDIIQKMASIREEIDKYFDKLEDDLKRELIAQHEAYLKLIHKENCTIEKCSNDIKTIKETVTQITDDVPASIALIIRSRMNGNLQQYSNTFNALSMSTKQTRQLIFKPTNVMTKLKTCLPSLGTITTSEGPPKTEEPESDNNCEQKTVQKTLEQMGNKDSVPNATEMYKTDKIVNETIDTSENVNENEMVKTGKTETERRNSENETVGNPLQRTTQSNAKLGTASAKRKTNITQLSLNRSYQSTENLRLISNGQRKRSTSSTSSGDSLTEHQTCTPSLKGVQGTASLTHKLQLSIFGSDIVATECCYLPDGKLVMVDTTGKWVLSCNDRGRQQKKVQFQQEPLDITVYDKTKLIVALGNDGMQILNVSSLRPLGKVINLGGRCTAVTHDKENVIVAVEDRLRLVTIDGRLIRNIDHPGLVWSLSAVFKGKIYYSDFTDDDDVLHCISLGGTNIFSYKNPQLIGPTGVAVDSHGNVYVAGLSSHNVHQLTPDGQLRTIILTKEDGIKYPRGMAYNKDKRELLLINQDRKVIQFYCIN